MKIASIIVLSLVVLFLFRLSPLLTTLLLVSAYLKPELAYSGINRLGVNKTETGRRFVSIMRGYLPDTTSIDKQPESSPAESYMPTPPLLSSASHEKHENLSYVDEVLIGVGCVGVVLSASFIYAQFSVDVAMMSLPVLVTLSALMASIALLLLGIVARQREKKCMRLFTLMTHVPEARISQLVSQSRFTLTALRRSVRMINSAGIGFLVLDEQNDRLYDGRLQARITLSHDCTNCGAGTEITIDIQSEQGVACSYCNSPFSAELINTLRHQRKRAVSDENRMASVHLLGGNTHSPDASPAPELSIAKLVLLSIFFWPGAVFYLAKYHLSNKMHTARLQAMITRQNASSTEDPRDSLAQAFK